MKKINEMPSTPSITLFAMAPRQKPIGKRVRKYEMLPPVIT